MSEFLRMEQRGAVATLWIDRQPKMNTMTVAMRNEFPGIFRELEADDAVRVVVIRGAGGKAFSAGGDVAEFLTQAPADLELWGDTLTSAERCRKPVLAAIDGFTMGAGLELAVACDFRIATLRSEFAFPEIRLGMIPGSGGTQRALRLIGMTRGKLFMMTGQRINAERAEAWGLITQVVANDKLDEAVGALAGELAERAPLALRTLKMVLNRGADAPLETALELERKAYAWLRSTHDYAEGVTSFLERRPPKYTRAMSEEPGWIGRRVARVEDARLLTGRGRFIDDHPPIGDIHAAAVVRSPHAHARIVGYNVSAALRMEGVVGVVTGEDVARFTRPFPVGVPAPVHYHCAATDKVRFVGEPVAVVVARSRYLAEDAAEAVGVEYEPLPAVVDVERALEPDAPILHEAVGTNLAGHRRLVYGDPDRAFAEADVVIRERFRFPKYGSTPIETYGVIARWDDVEEAYTVWSNFMGPFIMHGLVARVLGVPENRLRFIVSTDIGGSFGIKSAMYPYIALISLAARRTGVPVKWIEDRREHLMASSSGTDRVAHRELAAKKDGTVLAMRYRWLDNVGGYIRSPEPGCSFRPTGNFVGPYRFQHLEVDASVVMTNKSLTGPNRGYACGHLYFETERMMDLLAQRLGLDPVELRRRNLIEPLQMPYRTPTGGLYDSGDYPAVLDRAVELARYPELRREQAAARAAGRLFGIGVALAVDPSVSNMGYVAIALDPQLRAKPEYLPKSGAVEAATIKVDPQGRVTAILGTTPQGQGHQTVVAQIVADELGLTPADVTVVDEMDTLTRLWSISSGTYSSRFGSVGTSAVALTARKLKAKLVDYAAHLMEVPADQLEFRAGAVRPRSGKGASYSIKDLAGRAHWNTTSLPEGMEPGLQATAVFGFSEAQPVDDQDRVNSSNTYGFIAEVMAVEVDPETAAIKILRYATVHDAGTIINPMIAEGQIYGGALHGLGGALFEELQYDDAGQLLTGTFMDYLVPTASEAPVIDIAHVVSPSPLTPLGSKGLGESSSMTVPAVIANAVSDALAPLGIGITELPMSPTRLWALIESARRAGRVS